MVIGLWNFLLLGSTVTMGLKVARFPSTALAMSSGTGCAWTETQTQTEEMCKGSVKLSLHLLCNAGARHQIFTHKWVSYMNK